MERRDSALVLLYIFRSVSPEYYIAVDQCTTRVMAGSSNYPSVFRVKYSTLRSSRLLNAPFLVSNWDAIIIHFYLSI